MNKPKKLFRATKQAMNETVTTLSGGAAGSALLSNVLYAEFKK